MRILIIATIALTACTFAVQGEDYYELATALSKLTRVVDTANRYDTIDQDLSDEEFLNKAVAHDPKLLAPFDGYIVKLYRDRQESYLLVCESEKRALLGDSGCSPEMDKHYWKRGEPTLCTFDDSLVLACAQ